MIPTTNITENHANNQPPRITDFLAAFNSNPNNTIHLRAYKAKGAPDTKDNSPRTYSTTLQNLPINGKLQQKLRLDNQTRGMYFGVNSGGNDDAAITHYNAFFIESDDSLIAEQHEALNKAPLQPSIRVETKKSVHAYWLAAPGCSEDDWRAIQAALIAHFKSDPKIINPSRVMRVPNFDHVSYTDEQLLEYKRVKCVYFDPNRRFTTDEMKAAFTAPPNEIVPLPITSSTEAPLDDPNELNADVKALIKAQGKRNKKSGIYEMRGICHSGNGNTALCYNPATGNVWCNKKCSIAQIREAFNLPPRANTLLSLNSLNSPIRLDSQRPTLNRKQALYGLAGEIVRAIEPHTEADSTALLFQLLVAFGNVVGRSAFFKVEADKHYLNLFSVISGPSSSGRKGTSWGYINNLMASVDDSFSKTIVGGLTSGEGLIEHVKDLDSRTDKRSFVMETEFASVITAQKRDSSILSQTIRQAWDSGNLSVMRRSDPVKATNAHISIVGHITVDELRRTFAKNDYSNGYGNRFLWVYVERSKLLPEGGCFYETDQEPLIQKLRDAVIFGRSVGEMKRDEEARALWRGVYQELDGIKESDATVTALTERSAAQITRLSCIFALLDCSAIVKRVHLEAAKAVWDYSVASTRHIFGNGNSLSPRANKLLEALKENECGLSKTEMYTLFSNKLKATELETILSELEPFTIQQTTQTNGRSETRWLSVENGELSELSELSELLKFDEAYISSLPINPPSENYDWEERAAILEWDQGLTRADAEACAAFYFSPQTALAAAASSLKI